MEEDSGKDGICLRHTGRGSHHEASVSDSNYRPLSPPLSPTGKRRDSEDERRRIERRENSRSTRPLPKLKLCTVIPTAAIGSPWRPNSRPYRGNKRAGRVEVGSKEDDDHLMIVGPPGLGRLSSVVAYPFSDE